MDKHNWDDLGISWALENVSKQNGDHASDRVVLGKAEMPTVTDVAKFAAAFGDSCILGILNGTSLRVMAQDVNRRLIQKGQKGEAIRDAIYNRIAGTRNASARTVTVTVKVYGLPDGTTYSGTDLVEYQQAHVAANVANGVAADRAIQIASSLSL